MKAFFVGGSQNATWRDMQDDRPCYSVPVRDGYAFREERYRARQWRIAGGRTIEIFILDSIMDHRQADQLTREAFLHSAAQHMYETLQKIAFLLNEQMRQVDARERAQRSLFEQAQNLAVEAVRLAQGELIPDDVGRPDPELRSELRFRGHPLFPIDPEPKP